MVIYLAVVESHQHVLEHIHYVLRLRARAKRDLQRKNSKTKSTAILNNDDTNNVSSMMGWMMVHFDSHPDLACPSPHIPASGCFTPRAPIVKKNNVENANQTMISSYDQDEEENNFYDLLDTCQSGIAEWILPLVLAGDLQRLQWIKNEWCHQFSEGIYDYTVGAWIPPPLPLLSCIHNNDGKGAKMISSFLDLPDNAIVKTSLNHPYYLDDDSVVPASELFLGQNLQLHVLQLEQKEEDITTSNKEEIKSDSHNQLPMKMENHRCDWALDICLDYFICTNPFVTELESIDERITNTLLRTVTETNFRLSLESILATAKDSESSHMERCSFYRKEYFTFLRLSAKIFQSIRVKSTLSQNLGGIDSDNDAFTNIANIHLSKEEYVEFTSLYPTQPLAETIWTNLGDAILSWSQIKSENCIKKLSGIILNALQNLTLPSTTSPTVCSSYSRQQIFHQVKSMGNALRQRKSIVQRPPFIITIARSSDDGFTPKEIVEELQNAVIQEVHDIYCDCGKIGLFDSDDNSFEKSNGKANKICNFNAIRDYGDYEGSTFDTLL